MIHRYAIAINSPILHCATGGKNCNREVSHNYWYWEGGVITRTSNDQSQERDGGSDERSGSGVWAGQVREEECTERLDSTHLRQQIDDLKIPELALIRLKQQSIRQLNARDFHPISISIQNR